MSSSLIRRKWRIKIRISFLASSTSRALPVTVSSVSVDESIFKAKSSANTVISFSDKLRYVREGSCGIGFLILLNLFLERIRLRNFGKL